MFSLSWTSSLSLSIWIGSLLDIFRPPKAPVVGAGAGAAFWAAALAAQRANRATAAVASMGAARSNPNICQYLSVARRAMLIKNGDDAAALGATFDIGLAGLHVDGQLAAD